MALERRGDIVRFEHKGQPRGGRSPAEQTKPFKITKRQVYEAYKRIKANGGLSDNLYKLWNRLVSGSYHPHPVRRVEIPKGNGSVRPLGIPTVADRIAQMVVKQVIEPELDRCFHPDSYGYRPRKSAHQALAKAKQRCWQRPWVLDMDIKGFFDSIDHELLMRAVDKHVKEKWQRLYIERWYLLNKSGEPPHPNPLPPGERGLSD